ncbi:MAG: DUF3365 domain-containing protein [Pirellulaceae bacterium]
MKFQVVISRVIPVVILCGLVMGLGVGALALLPSAHAEDEVPAAKTVEPPPIAISEAKGRARLLHEAMHGALQVMHRDLFDEDESRSIPSRSLEDVFKGVEHKHGVSLRWLVVNADAMNVDNNPRDDFEKQAAKVLAKGEPFYEAVEENKYRFAGPVRLSSTCLKCHVPFRKSLEDRMAGLTISIPVSDAD